MKIPCVDRERPLALAPMDAITDSAARRLARRYGADLVTTEFVSAEGLVHEARKTIQKMVLSPEERPVAIQIFGSRIPAVVAAADMAQAARPDLLDLNFGCPARKVAGKGGGAGLLREPEKLEAMARAVVLAVALPVTAKVRLGWDVQTINVLDICQRLEQAGVVAVTVHARTRSQGYREVPDWSWIARVKQAVGIAVIGNGNVQTPEDAARMFDETGCDGVMIGRAATGHPWIFREVRHYLDTGEHLAPPSAQERMAVLLEYLRSSAVEKGERRAVVEARKQYRGFFKGLPGATQVRAALMALDEIGAVEDTLASLRSRLEEFASQRGSRS
jgi:tRNA-dihydrouridine synthase B